MLFSPSTLHSHSAERVITESLTAGSNYGSQKNKQPSRRMAQTADKGTKIGSRFTREPCLFCRHVEEAGSAAAGDGNGDDRVAGAFWAPAAEDRQSGGFQFYSRAGEASLLRGQRPSGAGAGGVVQAVAAGLSVRSAFGAAADARGGGERGLPLVPRPQAPGQGAGRLDAEPEPAPALRREHDLSGDLLPDRRAGAQESGWPRGRCCTPTRRT